MTEEEQAMNVRILALLPHGAGFNIDWRQAPLPRRSPAVRRLLYRRAWYQVYAFVGGFHYMNPRGYYDGWAHPVVTIAWGVVPSAVEWAVSWRSDASTRRVLRLDPGLKDYVEDTISMIDFPRLTGVESK